MLVRHRLRCILLTSAVSLLAAGCSPYVYGPEIAKFGSAVTATADAARDGQARLAEDYAIWRRIYFVGGRIPFDGDQHCFPIDASPCSLRAIAANPMARAEPAPNAAERLAQTAAVGQMVAALKQYADALVAVTNKADRDDFDSAVASLAANAGKVAALGAAANPAVGAAAPGITTAILNAAGAGIGATLDQRRYAALRRSVDAVDDHVATLAAETGKALQALRSQRRGAILGSVQLLAAQSRRAASDQSFATTWDIAQTRVQTANALLEADPTKVTASLAAAHRALREALRDHGRQIAPLVETLGTFGDQADALRKAFAAPARP